MSHPNSRLMARWFELQTSHDLEAMPALFTDDIVYEDVALDIVKHGPAGVVELMRTLYHAFPDYSVTIVSAVADDVHGGAEMVMAGTNAREVFGVPGTGKPFSIRASAAAEFRDGRIARWRDYWSVATFRRQVGAEVD